MRRRGDLSTTTTVGGGGCGGFSSAAGGSGGSGLVPFDQRCFFLCASASVFSAGGSGFGCVSTTPSSCIGPSATSCASISSGRPPGGTLTRVWKDLYPSARTSIRCEPAATVCTNGGNGPDGLPSMKSSAVTEGDGVTTTFPGRTSSGCSSRNQTPASSPSASGRPRYSGHRRGFGGG